MHCQVGRPVCVAVGAHGHNTLYLGIALELVALGAVLDVREDLKIPWHVQPADFVGAKRDYVIHGMLDPCVSRKPPCG